MALLIGTIVIKVRILRAMRSSKDAAVSYEHHFDGNSSGWEVKYTRKTDKLFLIF